MNSTIFSIEDLPKYLDHSKEDFQAVEGFYNYHYKIPIRLFASFEEIKEVLERKNEKIWINHYDEDHGYFYLTIFNSMSEKQTA